MDCRETSGMDYTDNRIDYGGMVANMVGGMGFLVMLEGSTSIKMDIDPQQKSQSALNQY